jgi:hypothetical protein
MGTAELALSLPNGRSVEILVVPPPQAVAILAGGPTATRAEKDPFRTETSLNPSITQSQIRWWRTDLRQKEKGSLYQGLRYSFLYLQFPPP